MDLDHLLNQLNDLGKYQLILLFLFGYEMAFDAMQVLSPVFVLHIPEYRCISHDNGTLYANISKDYDTPISKCIIRDMHNNSRACSKWIYDNTSYHLTAGMEFNLVCDRLFYRALSNMMYMLGLMVGAVLGGELSDRITPESPRWLLVKGRKKDAERIIKRIAKVNSREVHRDELDAIDVTTESKKRLSIMFKNKTLRNRAFILACNWAAISATYHGLSYNSGNLHGNLYINYLITGIVEAPSLLFALFVPWKFGYKVPHIFSMVLGGVSCFSSLFVVLFAEPSLQGWMLTLLSTIGKFGASVAYALIYVFAAQLIPTSLRNATIGACSTCSRVGNLIAPFITDLGELIGGDLAQALPIITFGVICISAGLLCIFLPETYGKPLPQTVQEAYSLKEKKKRERNSRENVMERPT